MCLVIEPRSSGSPSSPLVRARARVEARWTQLPGCVADIEKHQHMAKLGLRLAVALLAVLGWSCSVAPLPPLPDPALEDFAPPVQEQLRSMQAKATASPEDANAVGDFGSALYAYGQLQASAACFERSRELAPEVFGGPTCSASPRLRSGVRRMLGPHLKRRRKCGRAISRPPCVSRICLSRPGTRPGQSGFSSASMEEASGGAAAHFRLGRLVATEDSG